MDDYREEKDSLGIVKVPKEAYYGAQTQRARENFPISGLRLQPLFIKAQGTIKAAAAKANLEEGRLDAETSAAIFQAAEEVRAGEWDNQFVVDAYQAGGGTSQNMNANEVIANRALEILGKGRGDYACVHPDAHVNLCHSVHPNDDVNRAQSTNDTIHAATQIAAVEGAQILCDALTEVLVIFEQKSAEFKDVIKSGRTHLQDTVPMTLGQEFGAYGEVLKTHRTHIHAAMADLLVLPLGGTAIGTSINAGEKYTQRVVEVVSELTDNAFTVAPNLFAAMQNMDSSLTLSSTLRNLAVSLTKIANDLRLLSSGPTTGFAEINLPAVQPGSSIMPGKVNPVMAEMLNMIAYQVVGNDVVVTGGVQGGQLEVNVMMPVIAYNLLNSLYILTEGLRTFGTRCVAGITANVERCRAYYEHNPVIATALSPHLGYLKTAELVKEAYERSISIRELVLEKGLLDAATLDKALDFKQLSSSKE